MIKQEDITNWENIPDLLEIQELLAYIDLGGLFDRSNRGGDYQRAWLIMSRMVPDALNLISDNGKSGYLKNFLKFIDELKFKKKDFDKNDLNALAEPKKEIQKHL